MVCVTTNTSSESQLYLSIVPPMVQLPPSTPLPHTFALSGGGGSDGAQGSAPEGVGCGAKAEGAGAGAGAGTSGKDAMEMQPVGEPFEERIVALALSRDGCTAVVLCRSGLALVTDLATGNRRVLDVLQCRERVGLEGEGAAAGGQGADGERQEQQEREGGGGGAGGEQLEVVSASFSPDLTHLAMVTTAPSGGGGGSVGGGGASSGGASSGPVAKVQVLHLWGCNAPGAEGSCRVTHGWDLWLPLQRAAGGSVASVGSVELAWSASGSALVAWVRDGAARVWEVRRDGGPQLLGSFRGRARHCVMMGDLGVAVCEPSGRVRVFDLSVRELSISGGGGGGRADWVEVYAPGAAPDVAPGVAPGVAAGVAADGDSEGGVGWARLKRTMYACWGFTQAVGDGSQGFMFVPPVRFVPHIYRFASPAAVPDAGGAKGRGRC